MSAAVTLNTDGTLGALRLAPCEVTPIELEAFQAQCDDGETIHETRCLDFEQLQKTIGNLCRSSAEEVALIDDMAQIWAACRGVHHAVASGQPSYAGRTLLAAGWAMSDDIKRLGPVRWSCIAGAGTRSPKMNLRIKNTLVAFEPGPDVEGFWGVLMKVSNDQLQLVNEGLDWLDHHADVLSIEVSA